MQDVIGQIASHIPQHPVIANIGPCARAADVVWSLFVVGPLRVDDRWELPLGEQGLTNRLMIIGHHDRAKARDFPGTAVDRAQALPEKTARPPRHRAPQPIHPGSPIVVIVAAKLLVAAITGQHHLELGGREFAHHQRRQNRNIGKRFINGAHNAIDPEKQISFGNINFLVFGI